MIFVVGRAGLEPAITASETVVLPITPSLIRVEIAGVEPATF